MNAFVHKTNHVNRRQDSPNIQRKVQKINMAATVEDDFVKSQFPKQRKVRRVRSIDNRSERKTVGIDDKLSPLQLTLQRSKSSRNTGDGSQNSGGGSGGDGSHSDRTTAESIIELLELSKSSPFLETESDTNLDTAAATTNGERVRTLLSRTYSEQIETPLRRSKRAGVRPPLRMMPKEKSSSMGDLYNEDGRSNRRGSQKKLDCSSTSAISDFIITSSKNPNARERKESITNESLDGSFFQDVPSILGDFHIDKSHRKQKKESNVSPEWAVENSWRHSLPNSSPQQNRSILHSLSGDDEKARRSQPSCSAGGKVRNHRTKEDYTGFFLTSNAEDDVKHGYGITKFHDGRLFEGVYNHGFMTEGKMTYPAEAGGFCPTYVGKFDQNGLRCGKGIYTTSTTTFLGQFRNDHRHGSGILMYHDGNESGDTSQSRRFIGNWKDGRKHGYGKEILANGTIAQEGLWEEGYFVGNPTST